MPRPTCAREAVTAPDAELGEESMDRAGPGLRARRAVERVRAVELRPVALVDRDLVAAGVEDRILTHGGRIPLPAEVDLRLRGDLAVAVAVPLGGLGQDHGLGAMERVIGDGGHLVHVLGGGVDQRVAGVELAIDDGPAPGVAQQGQDGLGAFGGAAIDELAVLVVAQLDVLRLAEALQGVSALLRSQVGVTGRAESDDADDEEDHTSDPKP